VYYPEGGRLRPADLLYDGDQPILVVSWKTVNRRREPDIAAALDPDFLTPVKHREGEYIYQLEPLLKPSDR
jgi:hypothetical protein